MTTEAEVVSEKREHEFVVHHEYKHSPGEYLAVCRKCGLQWPSYGDLCPMPVCPESIYRFR
jgi:hypothetical protein